MCGIPENGQALSVHHIDWIKENCEYNNLISTCRHCHPRHTSDENDKQWTRNFQRLFAEGLIPEVVQAGPG